MDILGQMITKIHTSTIVGIEAQRVEVEVHVRTGQKKFAIIGLADNAIKESRERISIAIKQSGFKMPDQVLVNLAPAEVKKEGASFDLAIALGVLIASKQVDGRNIHNSFLFGELSLDGKVRAVRGMVALAISALQAGAKTILVPRANTEEASLVSGLELIGVDTIIELVSYLQTGELIDRLPEPQSRSEKYAPMATLSDVWGQEQAKRALIIAAAGGHNILMIGPPGCGKSMLAARFKGILPQLSDQEILEVVRIHSVSGLPVGEYLQGLRPYRNPHHVVSDVGLVGGGPKPRPGEITLAHRGVLFLDEFPEYRRTALEALRAPLESGKVQITRARGSIEFPASFQLIAAMNPCPCGRLGSGIGKCLCTQAMIQGYLSRLSEPILDRIDLHVELDAVPIGKVACHSTQIQSSCDSQIKEWILMARERQLVGRGALNSRIDDKKLMKESQLTAQSIKLLERAAEFKKMSARGLVRAIRVARSIADLDDSSAVNDKHLAEAIGLRGLERLKEYCH